MKLLIALIMISLAGLGCTEKGNYLDKIAPPKAEAQQKIADVEALIFSAAVDILFVVDDSGSMMSHQENLSRNMSLFIDELAKDQILDYHIGVITTDMSKVDRSGRLVGMPHFVDRTTDGGLIALQHNVMVGTSGSASEQLFGPILKALSFPLVDAENAGFYRPEAHLAIVFLSDAEDQTQVTPEYFLEFLTRLKGGDKEKILAYASYVPSNVLGCPRDGGNPLRLETVLTALNAKSYSLCDPDFGKKLAGLAADLSEKVGSFVPMAQLPDPSTIKVTFGTQVIPNDERTGWVYDNERVGLKLGRDLEFDEEQPEGTTLKVDFVPADMAPKGYTGKLRP